MSKKSILVLVSLYLVQFIYSCNPCNCDQGTYSVDIKGMDIRAFDTFGFSVKPVSDTVNKDAFGITVSAIYNLTKISEGIDFSGSGFSSAFACDCLPNDYYANDSIKEVKLFVRDVSRGDFFEVTGHFSIAGTKQPLESREKSFLRNFYFWDYNNAALDLILFDSIPQSAIFKVEGHLKSGIVLKSETDRINFF